MKTPRHILPLIVLAQFMGTSLWFAGNAIVGDIITQFALGKNTLSDITATVQFGFITGTLLFALFTITDRFSPSRIFFACAVAGALANLSILLANGLPAILLSRFVTGFFLAGIYPVGMKIAADHHDKGLGKALGYLVGAMVMGTAFPHLLRATGANYNWHYIIIFTSSMATVGGLLIWLFVPNGPYRAKGSKTDLKLVSRLFKNQQFRSAAFGYFGHMWELYTLWALIPGMYTYYISQHADVYANVSLWSFLTIAAGTAGCILGGYISLRKGNAKVAFTALLLSGICCLTAFFMFQLPVYIFIPLFIIWGMSVAADSPQFSSMVAQAVTPAERGTALTISNCIGFAITIVSIRFIASLQHYIGERNVFFIVAFGPLFGIIGMRRLLRPKP